MSHEHDGPGGMIDFQEHEVDRLGGDDWAKRERVKMLAWQKPKAARRALISGLLQLNANFIFCFRAREKSKPMKINGKTEIIELGFMPIAGEEFLFEMTANCMLPPKSMGVPVWQSEHVGERATMKLPSYLAHVFPKDKAIDEETGRALATWAAGTPSHAPGANPAPPAESTKPAADGGAGNLFDSDKMMQWDKTLEIAACEGAASLKNAWGFIPKECQASLKSALDLRHKPAAAKVDRAKETVS